MNMNKTCRSKKIKKKLSIGVFDSGLGGLTVLKYLLKNFPGANFIYLGDLQNLPFGNKSTKRVIECSLRCTRFLLKQEVDVIVIACNTASSCAYESVKKEASLPVFDVIRPCVKEISINKNLRVAILGTEKTIKSEMYPKLIKLINPNAKIFNIACPLFVPIVEEGLEATDLANQAIEYYLNVLKKMQIDKVILACTHYPILLPKMKQFLGDRVKIVDSGYHVANLVKNKIGKSGLAKTANIRYYVTDLPERFKKNGSIFLGQKINSVSVVKI